MLLSLFFENPFLFFLVAAALVISLSIHEFAHAYIALKLGDDTAKNLGRVTLNPASHLDPLGTILLLVAGFGWGKPVPFNPYNLKFPKRDSALIALAGPVSNFILAFAFAIIYHLTKGTLPLIAVFSALVITYNIMLGTFNLIPVHPLDGFKIVNGILPYYLSVQWMQLAPYGMFILLALLFTDAFGLILDPVLNFFTAILGLR